LTMKEALMPVSLRRTGEEQPQAPLQKAPKRDLTDIVVRMVIGLVINYVTRRLRKRQELVKARKLAARKVEKLAKKGKEIPRDLKEEAFAGLSRRKKKKAAEAARKAASAKKGKKGKKSHKLVWVLALAVVIALIAKAAGKK
jgi:hypothetical protein